MEIKKIGLNELETYRELSYRGYPSNRDFTTEGIQNFEENISQVFAADSGYQTFGAYLENKLVGIMFSIDFQMNIYNKMTRVSGLATLAVDPFYKRKGIAQQMVNFYEADAKERGIHTALLLPFRPDYYVNKGYGYLTKMNHYEIETHYCPKYSGHLRVKPLSDVDEIFQLHHEVTLTTHGMFDLILLERVDIIEAFADYENVFVGVYDEDKLVGYTSYKVLSEVEGNYTLNYIQASDLVVKSGEALQAILGHFNGQQDQASYVKIYTQLKGFEHIFVNPLNQTGDYFAFGYLQSNTQGIGLMGKVLDAEKWLCEHGDSFKTETPIQWLVGEETYGEGEPVEIKTEHLAPLWYGAVSFTDLYKLDLIKCKPEIVKELSRVFTGDKYPINFTDF